MSYEGYTQIICANGHHTTPDAYWPSTSCESCGAPIKYWRSVDETNGYWEDDISTQSAGLIWVGAKYMQTRDPLGNPYYVPCENFYIPRDDRHWHNNPDVKWSDAMKKRIKNTEETIKLFVEGKARAHFS